MPTLWRAWLPAGKCGRTSKLDVDRPLGCLTYFALMPLSGGGTHGSIRLQRLVPRNHRFLPRPRILMTGDADGAWDDLHVATQLGVPDLYARVTEMMNDPASEKPT